MTDIRNLETRQLLLLYRKKRIQKYKYTCSCCNEFIWNIGHGDEKDKEEYYLLMNELDSLKKELSTREHIPNKKERKKIRQKKQNRRFIRK